MRSRLRARNAIRADLELFTTRSLSVAFSPDTSCNAVPHWCHVGANRNFLHPLAVDARPAGRPFPPVLSQKLARPRATCADGLAQRRLPSFAWVRADLGAGQEEYICCARRHVRQPVNRISNTRQFAESRYIDVTLRHHGTQDKVDRLH